MVCFLIDHGDTFLFMIRNEVICYDRNETLLTSFKEWSVLLYYSDNRFERKAKSSAFLTILPTSYTHSRGAGAFESMSFRQYSEVIN
jgi:hypothetical protein